VRRPLAEAVADRAGSETPKRSSELAAWSFWSAPSAAVTDDASHPSSTAPWLSRAPPHDAAAASSEHPSREATNCYANSQRPSAPTPATAPLSATDDPFPTENRGPAESEPCRPERLTRPRVERERVTVLRDQAVLEPKLGANIVVHPATSRERVVSEPVGGSVLIVCAMLQQLHIEVVGATGEHPPHGSWLRSSELSEDRVREARTRCVARGHCVAVERAKGPVEAPDQLDHKTQRCLATRWTATAESDDPTSPGSRGSSGRDAAP